MMRKSRRSSTNKEMICDYKTKCVIKIVKQIMFISLLAILVMGCSVKKEDNNYQYFSISKPEVDAYKLFLTEKLENPQKNRETGFKVALIRLDEDEVYEMALLSKNDSEYPLTLYGYQGGQVVELNVDEVSFTDGPGRTFAYLEGQNCFYYSRLRIEGDDSLYTKVIFSMENGQPYLEHTISYLWASYETQDPDTASYYFDSEEITREEYKELNNKKYNLNLDLDRNLNHPEGFYEIRADYLTEVDSTQDLEKALSKDYFYFYSIAYHKNEGQPHPWGT